MRSLPRLARTLLAVGLAVYDVSAMVWPGHLLRPASTLSGERAERWFLRWRNSPLALQRQLAKGAKGLLCLAYYEMPEVQHHLGYRPDLWITKVREQRQADYGAVIQAQADQLTRTDPMTFRGDLM